ncbi:MAG: lyase [Verrucomicrobia bacterium]|nr:MAG: lyase [Verrucomicrobiota bacterium]
MDSELMNFIKMFAHRSGLKPALLLLAAGLFLNSLGNLSAAQPSNSSPPVTLRESEKTFFLDNGIVNVRIEKSSGEIFSVKYKGVELLAQDSAGGALGGYWSSVGRARGGTKLEAVVRIDPKTNDGERAEVSCNFHNPPGAKDSPLDVDVRYALGRGESGVYTYLIWSHKPGYPSFNVGEARFCAKLNPGVFDYMSIDKDRRRQMPTSEDWDKGAPLNLKEARRMTTGVHKGEAEHKYDYSALIYEIPAYGWSSTKHRLGLWFVNPSFEYMAGGPTKAELTGHLDVNPGGVPTLLNMWLGSHYGGTSLVVGENENWTKLVGPMMIYCNSADDGSRRREEADGANLKTNPPPYVGGYDVHEAMWKEALARAQREAKRWPYAWVSDANYPSAKERGVVSGRIVLRDPYAPDAKMSNIWVGVTAPDYVPPPMRFGSGGQGRFGTNFSSTNLARFQLRSGFPTYVDWQRDAKFYQFWVRADERGRFEIPKVRPGTYTFHVIADGVLGAGALTNVVVMPGGKTKLGTINWSPTRFGKTVWQIGVPDRTAREFRHGDHYWQWGLYFDYAKEFPDDVHFVIGKSDWRKDWNYVQPPRIEGRNVSIVSEGDEEADPPRDRFGRDSVRSSTWTIEFEMPEQPRGQAVLRLAFCGTHQSCNVEAVANGQSVGETGTLPSTSAMQRDGIRAFWIEKPIAFDAALLKPGKNLIQLKSHANSWSQGVMYDCVRLEMAEAVTAN